LSAEVIENDRHFDVMSGSAGVILGLLALHRAAPRAAGVIETAIDAGKHLLKNREVGHGESRAWRNSASRPLTGFSHGAAGIAYALTKLFEATQDSTFLDAALEAIAYERALFDPEESNWPDLRTHRVEGFACSWCHGAPGIGLARLGVSTTVNRDDIRSDIAAAVRRTSEATLDDVDHLCCGNFGRLELMLQAGQRDHALRAARWIYHRAQTNQGYRLVHKPIPGVYSPAFFRGTAGIGHQLLRLAEPSAVPSVLLMQ
jgi:lantibiotic modifying enzyme